MKNFIKKINLFLKQFKICICSTFLCLKYPFLRFGLCDGKQTPYKIGCKIRKLNREGGYHHFSKTIETNEPWDAFIIYDQRKLNRAKFLEWLNNYIFQPFYFIQSSCYFFCIPKGWRKSFGLQMCEEIKQSLLRSGGRKALYKYGIFEVKEKYGGLRWYDYNGTSEVNKIINKYEQISYHTCIECGIPATVQTTGWICPYCDKCKPENQYYIHFGHKNGPKWYGWMGNMDYIPEDKWKEEEELLNNRP